MTYPNDPHDPTNGAPYGRPDPAPYPAGGEPAASPYTQPQYAPYAQQPAAPGQQPTPYAPSPYGQYGYAAPSEKWNGMAIAGFVCSFLISIVGLVLSIIGYGQTKKTGEKGGGLALAGIIISAVSLGLAILGVILAVLFGIAIFNSVDFEHLEDYDYDSDRSYYSEDLGAAQRVDRESPEALLAGLTVR